MKIDVHIVNAFTDSKPGGNPTGVVVGKEWLSNEQMLSIAKKLGNSETVFAVESDDAINVRFFTPTQEMATCMHGTLVARQVFKRSHKNIKTPTGTIPTEFNFDNGRIAIQLPHGAIMNYFCNRRLIARVLNAKIKILDERFPMAIVSIGTPKLLVKVKKLADLLDLDPDMNMIKEVCILIECRGIYVFCDETMFDNATYHARQFNPLCGIDEDPATGIAAGALIHYLEYKDLTTKFREKIIEQGYSLNKPCELRIENRSDGFNYLVGSCTLDEKITLEI